MIRVEGFGQPVASASLQAGQLATLFLGERVFLLLRVACGQGAPKALLDLQLAQLSGPPDPEPFPRVREPAEGQYVSITGEVIARPTGFAFATAPPTVVLMVDEAGRAFVRNEAGGEYYDFSTGEESKPGAARANFSAWELIQKLGEQQWPIHRFGVLERRSGVDRRSGG